MANACLASKTFAPDDIDPYDYCLKSALLRTLVRGLVGSYTRIVPQRTLIGPRLLPLSITFQIRVNNTCFSTDLYMFSSASCLSSLPCLRTLCLFAILSIYPKIAYRRKWGTYLRLMP